MTYEYLCTACGHHWEAEQSISAEPLKTCPECKQEAAKRQVSGGAGFILKGGGWYADLYSSAKPGSKSEGGSESKSSSSTATPATTASPSSSTASSSSDSSSSSTTTTKSTTATAS